MEKEITYLPIKTTKDIFTIGGCGKFNEEKKHINKTEAIYDEGIEIYSLGEEKVLDNFQGKEKEKQIRQNITMILSKPLSKNKIYQIINQVESQPIKFN